MSMELVQTPAQEFSHSQTMRVSARLVASNHMLQLSSQELHQAIAAELEENPALEMIDVPSCSECRTALEGSQCPLCIRRQQDGPTDTGLDDFWSGYEESHDRRQPADDDRGLEPLAYIAC